MFPPAKRSVKPLLQVLAGAVMAPRPQAPSQTPSAYMCIARSAGGRVEGPHLSPNQKLHHAFAIALCQAPIAYFSWP